MKSLKTKSSNEEIPPEDKIIDISEDGIKEIKPEKKFTDYSSQKNLEKPPQQEGDFNINEEIEKKEGEDPYSIPNEQNPDIPKINLGANDELLKKTTEFSEIENSKKAKENPSQGIASSPRLEKNNEERRSLQEEVSESVNVKENVKKPLLKTIRTYQSDVVETMKRQKTSVTSMVLAENKKRFSSGGKKNINLEKKKKGRLLMVAIFSLLFLLVGILAVYFVKKEQNKLPPEIKELPIPKLILSNYTQELYVDRIKRDNLIFETEREKENISIPLGEIIQLYLTTEDTSKQFVVENTDGYKLIVTTKSYLDALEAKAPSSLSRALSSDFVFGYHSSLGNNPFLLFEVKSYNTAFASMLEWEKTMYKDLSPIFVRENSSIDLSNKNFKDIVVVNKDVRAILNNNGKIEFAYSFPNPNTLIIVNNKTTLEEIFRRVTNAQFERKN